MRDGMVRLVYNPKVKDRIPPGALAHANAAQHAIVTGRLSIGSDGASR
jgi:hypothetical protein